MITILPDAQLLKAIRSLADNNIGPMPGVFKDKILVGIVSERDLISCIRSYGCEVDSMVVADVMTKTVIAYNLEDEVKDVLGVMNEHAIRHMPVIEDAYAATMISSRDVIDASLKDSLEHRRALAVAYQIVR